MLSLAQVAPLNFQGMGARARRHAVERAVTCRLEDGAYSVNCLGEEDEPIMILDDDEYVVDPKCDHHGYEYASAGFEEQNRFFKTMVPRRRTGYEGWPDVRPSAKVTRRTETSGKHIHVELGLSRDEEVRHLDHMMSQEEWRKLTGSLDEFG